MFKRGSKITMLMLVVVFCAFALVGCGDTNDDINNDNNDEITDTNQNGTVKEDTDENGDLQITITSPMDGDTIESGTIAVVGTVEADNLTGIDKVKLQVITKDDGTVLGEDTSLIADLDHQYSADISYEIPDDIAKNDDGTVDAELRVYIEDDNSDLVKEDKISIKVK
jgi:hypothetical protein